MLEGILNCIPGSGYNESPDIEFAEAITQYKLGSP